MPPMRHSPLADWLDHDPVLETPPAYHYQGVCPLTGQTLSLPRTSMAEVLAHRLMSRLDQTAGEGKMFGVLLIETTDGPAVLCAHSGNGPTLGLPWVPPIGTQQPTALEQETLIRLEQLKARLGELASAPERTRLVERQVWWHNAQQIMNLRHKAAQSLRAQSRPNLDLEATERLNDESRAEGLERRHFKRDQAGELDPLRKRVAALDQEILETKRQRRQLSRNLQAELHANFEQSLFPGEPWSLASLFPAGPPTGTGECCAPKLLHFAKIHNLQPLAMAEFWWGPPPPGGGRREGQFYGACAERCQPLLGPLLTRASRDNLRILYEDDELLVVDKPSGVLTVPGRTSWNQDSLLNRLRPGYPELKQVHRLDLETSGIVLWARSDRAQASLQRQFEARGVEKLYQALLENSPTSKEGTIELALGPDPLHPGRYQVDPDGKAALTRYRVIEGRRVEFRPETGRSHQLRVHAATGLGCPIQGDRLYGKPGGQGRLMLHAWRLTVTHPDGHTQLEFEAPLPF